MNANSKVVRLVTDRPCPLWVSEEKRYVHAEGNRCMWCEGTKFVVEYREELESHEHE